MNKEFTNYLNLFGLKKLEPIVLASLVNEEPILLIGKHGSAKSFLLERISKALEMNYKFYNASLIDYDDLVGIPVPNKDNTKLEYISSPTSIWDAEVVFIDEINRTKPELQNKIFPIIYEKRVQGEDLKDLKFRFAAMNPNYDDSSDYFGTMPLDSALADRFGFIVSIPSWDELDETSKKEAITNSYKEIDYKEGGELLKKLIKLTKELYTRYKDELEGEINNLVLDLMPLLTNKFGYLSTRRALIIKDNILAVHASKVALKTIYESDDEVLLKDSIYEAVASSLPQRASEYINLELLYKTIKTVTDSIDLDAITKKFLLMTDKVKQICYGFKNINKIDKIVVFESLPTALSSLDEPKKLTLSYLLSKKLSKYDNCPANIVETITNLAATFYNYADFAVERRFAGYEIDNNKTNLKKVLEKQVEPEIQKEREKVLTTLNRCFPRLKDLEIYDEFFINTYKELGMNV